MAFIGIDIGPSNPKTSLSPEIWSYEPTEAEVDAVARGDFEAWARTIPDDLPEFELSAKPGLRTWLLENGLGSVVVFLETQNPSCFETDT